MEKSNRRCFSFSGLTIETVWDDRLSEKELRFLFSIVPFCERQGLSHPANITLICKNAKRPFEAPECDFQTLESYGLPIYNGCDQSTVSDGDSSFTVDHQSGIGRVSLHPTFSAKPALTKSNFFLMGLVHLFAQRQVDALTQLIQRSDCYSLEAGRDLYANPVKAA